MHPERSANRLQRHAEAPHPPSLRPDALVDEWLVSEDRKFQRHLGRGSNWLQACPLYFRTVSDAQTIAGTIQRAITPIAPDATFALTPIDEVDVLGLQPPTELLRQIEALAVAVDALLRADLVDQARPLAAELRTIVESARFRAAKDDRSSSPT